MVSQAFQTASQLVNRGINLSNVRRDYSSEVLKEYQRLKNIKGYLKPSVSSDIAIRKGGLSPEEYSYYDSQREFGSYGVKQSVSSFPNRQSSQVQPTQAELDAGMSLIQRDSTATERALNQSLSPELRNLTVKEVQSKSGIDYSRRTPSYKGATKTEVALNQSLSPELRNLSPQEAVRRIEEANRRASGQPAPIFDIARYQRGVERVKQGALRTADKIYDVPIIFGSTKSISLRDLYGDPRQNLEQLNVQREANSLEYENLSYRIENYNQRVTEFQNELNSGREFSDEEYNRLIEEQQALELEGQELSDSELRLRRKEEFLNVVSEKEMNKVQRFQGTFRDTARSLLYGADIAGEGLISAPFDFIKSPRGFAVSSWQGLVGLTKGDLVERPVDVIPGIIGGAITGRVVGGTITKINKPSITRFRTPEIKSTGTIRVLQEKVIRTPTGDLKVNPFVGRVKTTIPSRYGTEKRINPIRDTGDSIEIYFGSKPRRVLISPKKVIETDVSGLTTDSKSIAVGRTKNSFQLGLSEKQFNLKDIAMKRNIFGGYTSQTYNALGGFGMSRGLSLNLFRQTKKGMKPYKNINMRRTSSASVGFEMKQLALSKRVSVDLPEGSFKSFTSTKTRSGRPSSSKLDIVPVTPKTDVEYLQGFGLKRPKSLTKQKTEQITSSVSDLISGAIKRQKPRAVTQPKTTTSSPIQSAFYGTGQYERTDSTSSFGFVNAKSRYSLVNQVETTRSNFGFTGLNEQSRSRESKVLGFELLSGVKQSQQNLLGESFRRSTRTRNRESTSVASSFGLASDQAQRLEERQISSNKLSRQINPNIPFNIPRIDIPKTPTRIIPKLKDKDDKSKSQFGFLPQIKIGGRFRTISKAVSREEALEIGARRADITLSRTFRIVPTKTKVAPSKRRRTSAPLFKFRTFKQTRGRRTALRNTFIEKSKYSLEGNERSLLGKFRRR